MSIQTYIDQMYAFIKSDSRVTVENGHYLNFKNSLTDYVFSHHLDETPEWDTIKQNLVWRSGQHMVRSEADRILVALESLKEIELKRKNFHTLNAWNYLHPLVAKISQEKFLHEDYAGSVQDVFLELNNRLKILYKRSTGEEKDGVDLMRQVFSPNNPVLKLGDIGTKTGRDMQEGYMHLFEGAMMAIRNPSAHERITISSVDAMRKLMLASLLMTKIDEATRS